MWRVKIVRRGTKLCLGVQLRWGRERNFSLGGRCPPWPLLSCGPADKSKQCPLSAVLYFLIGLLKFKVLKKV